MRRIVVLLVGAALVPVLALPVSAGGGAKVFPPGDAPLGTSYREWAGEYMIWIQEIPRNQNPAHNPDSPRNCEVVNGVIFLGFAGSDCDVPADTPAMFGTFGWECSTAEGLGRNFRRLTRCAKRNFRHDFDPDRFNQTIWIDGQRLPADRRWTYLTPGEVVDFPERNIWLTEPGPSKSVTKGFFYVLQPLAAGDHKVRVLAVDEAFGRFRIVWKLHAA